MFAEFVGTLTFVAVGTGAATALLLGPIQALGGITEFLGPEEGVQSVWGALLGNNLGDLLAVALAFAFALSFLVYAFGGVSGAHFNPAVTFALAVSRRFRWKELPHYWVAQCLGAIVGSIVIAGIYGRGDPGGADVLFGATVIPAAVTNWQALLAEAFIAFVLVTAIMAVAVDPRAPKGWAGLIIGLALAAGIIVTGPASGGSANFARSLGPFVASMLYDSPPIPWSDLLVYFFGPLIGASAAALAYESLTGLEAVAPAPSPGAATPVVGDSVEEALVHEHEAHHHEEPVVSDDPVVTKEPPTS
jgi:glycerol uptake facilitator protein